MIKLNLQPKKKFKNAETLTIRTKKTGESISEILQKLQSPYSPVEKLDLNIEAEPSEIKRIISTYTEFPLGIACQRPNLIKVMDLREISREILDRNNRELYQGKSECEMTRWLRIEAMGMYIPSSDTVLYAREVVNHPNMSKLVNTSMHELTHRSQALKPEVFEHYKKNRDSIPLEKIEQVNRFTKQFYPRHELLLEEMAFLAEDPDLMGNPAFRKLFSSEKVMEVGSLLKSPRFFYASF